MFNRLVPIFALLVIFALAVMSYIFWRSAEREPRAATQPAAANAGNHRLATELIAEELKLAEAYALRAEAAAARAQIALEQVEAYLKGRELPLPPALPLPAAPAGK